MPEPMRDEALEEIWATRRRIWEEVGGTWEGYMRHLDALEADLERRGATIIHEPRPRPLEPDETALVREEPPE